MKHIGGRIRKWGIPVVFLILILNAQVARNSMQKALALCIQVLIPSLFPFFVIALLMLENDYRASRFSVGLLRLLKVPSGAESLLAIGFLGGYPTGAQAIAEFCAAGRLDTKAGMRMLGFCCNAGPAFFFGIGMQILGNAALCFLSWMVHICSALFVGLFASGVSTKNISPTIKKARSFSEILNKSMKSMALVCAWVIIMKICTDFIFRILPGSLSKTTETILLGFLEITGGCCTLIGESQIGKAFLLFNAFTAFGGICVLLQTRSVTEGKVDFRCYWVGKTTQTAFSLLISEILQFIFSSPNRYFLPIGVRVLCVAWCVAYIFIGIMQKRSGNLRIYDV